VDHLPESETDSFQIFAAVTEQPVGIFQATSMWKGSWELFRHESHGDGKMDLVYPQSKERERLSYRAAKCSQKGFDFCLEVAGASRGVARYFSQKGWELRGARTAPALEEKARALVYHAGN
jgi:hypothetical protein